MNQKMIAVIAVVAVLVVGGVTVAVILANNNHSDEKPYAYFDGVGLKVLGNVDKDNEITQNDYDEVQKLINDKASASGDNKLADANNDGELNEDDLTVIKNVIDGTATSIWHISYHDTDGNGTMDLELVSTKYPVTSTIMTGSANNFIMFALIGIPAGDVVKGASYSKTSNDDFLYTDSYLKTALVQSLGSSSTTIEFENGKGATSDLINKEKVTCLVTDWNRTYITNEKTFEDAGVDVIRIAAASFDKEDYTHTISLLGTLFKQKENAAKIVKLYDDTTTNINDMLSKIPADAKKKAVASSMNGALSSEGSDYTAACEAAGAEFGLKGFDFGGSTSVYVDSNKGVFDTREYNFDHIIHIRTALTYKNTDATIGSLWAEYANAMGLWEKAYTGQILISGTVPVPLRVALITYEMYKGTVEDINKTWVDSIRSDFEKNYHIGSVDVSSKSARPLSLSTWNFKVTEIGDGVEVRDKNNNLVSAGDSFVYGTELSITATTPDATKTLVAENSSVKDGKFLVVNNIKAKYVPTVYLEAQARAAQKLAEYSGDGKYIQNAVANAEKHGSLQTTNVAYNGPDSTRVHSIYFEYYATVAEAKAAYDSYADPSKSVASKLSDTDKYTTVNTSTIVEASDNAILLGYSHDVHDAKKEYTGSTVYFVAYYKNIVLKADANGIGTGVYQSIYSYDSALYNKTSAELNTYWGAEALAFANAIEAALKAGMNE